MTFEIELPRALESAATARQAVGELSESLPEEVLGDVRLLVSELVTNAVRHAGGGAVRLVVAHGRGVLRVEVHDPGKGFEVAAPPEDPLRSSGWGLVLVAELADRWGVDHSPGTRVWFEMDG